MSDFIYCGTHPPVDADGTKELLFSSFNAIWYPPMRTHLELEEGDRIWLVWRENTAAIPVLLGGGRIVTTGEGYVLWTNRSLPGVVAAARNLGYGGPTNMAFLRLRNVKAPQDHPSVRLEAVSNGINVASEHNSRKLNEILPIS